MPEEVLLMPGEWNVGDTVILTKGDEVVVRGRIKEVIQLGIYKIDVEEGGIRGRGR